jgi:AraC-like DNA-binding protein
MDRLARIIERLAPSDGDHTTAIPSLSLHRRSSPTQPIPCIYGFALAIIVQGRKRVTVGDEVLNYGAGQSLLTTADLPVIAHVTQASAEEPFIGLMLRLDQRLIIQVAAEMALPPSPRSSTYLAMSIGGLEPPVLDAVARLLTLIEEPSLAPQLAPLVQNEIVVRLIAGQHGPKLRQIVADGSPSQQVARAMTWLKQHFTQAIPVDDLADLVHMSPSTFRHHFRAVAGMSPVQYQKLLRLQEARQLMLNEDLDAGAAALRVGYESASQFSREYGRRFGMPPRRDVNRMRDPSSVL